MTSPILVTGGTGTIGSHVVTELRRAGRDVRTLSRHARSDAPGIRHFEADLMTGSGVPAALDGVKVVLHVAGGPKGDDIATATLVTAARTADVEHLVLISVVGAGRMPIGYFRMKDAAERAIVESNMPWTVLRAAQLHDFVLPFVRRLARLPVVPAPRAVRFEPVDADVVAARLADIALGSPAGLVADIAGPEVLSIPQLVEQFNDVERRRGPRILRFGLPGAIGRAYRSGANLAGDDVLRAGGNWREYLEQHSAAVSAGTAR